MISRKARQHLYHKLRRIIAPTLRHSQSEYEDTLEAYVRPGTRWLDIGCGHGVLPPWRLERERQLVDRCESIVGVDYDLPSLQRHRTIELRSRADISRLPFGDGTFDLVTANMVVEHLADPARQFQEIRRVLRPGGIFVFHTPNALGYATVIARAVPERLKPFLIRTLDGRSQDDVFPTFYRANSQRRLRRIADECMFWVADINLVSTDAVCAVIPPLAVLELLWIRMLLTSPFRALRTNLIAVLRKSESAAVA